MRKAVKKTVSPLIAYYPDYQYFNFFSKTFFSENASLLNTNF
jgi:hypothetical protein